MTARALSEVRPIPRRGLSREEAAMYIGISPSKFDELVADGRMPVPVKGVGIWDSRRLDMAFDALKDAESNSYLAKEIPVDVKQSKIGGGIYFAGFGNYVKIGKSGYVEGRIKGLQTSAPEKIELYFVLDEDRVAESDFHKKFADLRVSGEWFRREGALAEFIAHVQEQLQ
jgi:hypothetical protein